MLIESFLWSTIPSPKIFANLNCEKIEIDSEIKMDNRTIFLFPVRNEIRQIFK